jgi:hypothetical protein
VKARPADRNFPGKRSAAGLHASRDSLYRIPRDKRQRRAGVIRLDLLPRWCPICRAETIIGHGRRWRQCHDERHTSLWVRRGICRPCGKTFTILPRWLAPSAPFSLRCRQAACEQIAAGKSLEEAAPHCQDPSRSPDPSTIRRWVYRRVLSVCCWAKAGAIGDCFLRAPTIVAWDLSAVCLMLPIEARSP